MWVNEKTKKWVLAVVFIPFTSTFATVGNSSMMVGSEGKSLSTENRQILNKSSFWDNWFVSAQVGGLYNWGSNESNSSFWHHLRPMGAVSVGKWISPSAGARLQGFYTNNRNIIKGSALDSKKSYHWDGMGINGDALFNFTNMFCGYRENRFFNMIGFVGLGWNHTTNYSKRNWNQGEDLYERTNNDLLSVHLGLIASFRLSQSLSLDLEVGNSGMDDSYDGTETNNRWDGYANVLVGVTYRFKNKDGNRQFTYARLDNSKIQKANEEVNRLHQQAEVIKAKIDTVTEGETVAKAYSSLVSFEANSSSLNELQQVNIYTAAMNFQKLNKDGRLYILPADSKIKDVNLYLQRAQSVREALIKEYNIPVGRIQVERDSNYTKFINQSQEHVIVYVVE